MFGLAGIMPKTLVQHLKDYMFQHHMNQADLAKKIPISSGGMSKIMSGKSKRPRPDMLRNIALATGLTYIQINAMLDPLLAEELASYSGDAPGDVGKPTLSPKARLVAEEFDKLPRATQDVFLTAVLNYHGGSGTTEK
jgi:transcriptional regulator with XRE-family HTH domain